MRIAGDDYELVGNEVEGNLDCHGDGSGNGVRGLQRASARPPACGSRPERSAARRVFAKEIAHRLARERERIAFG